MFFLPYIARKQERDPMTPPKSATVDTIPENGHNLFECSNQSVRHLVTGWIYISTICCCFFSQKFILAGIIILKWELMAKIRSTSNIFFSKTTMLTTFGHLDI